MIELLNFVVFAVSREAQRTTVLVRNIMTFVEKVLNTRVWFAWLQCTTVAHAAAAREMRVVTRRVIDHRCGIIIIIVVVDVYQAVVSVVRAVVASSATADTTTTTS